MASSHSREVIASGDLTDETVSLAHALEAQVDDERRKRKQREAAELEPEIIPAAQRSRRPGPRAKRPSVTVGDALR